MSLKTRAESLGCEIGMLDGSGYYLIDPDGARIEGDHENILIWLECIEKEKEEKTLKP